MSTPEAYTMPAATPASYEGKTATTVGGSRLLPHEQQVGTWHSPVPYLFGGLAATMALIAFALLIIACSYFKFSGDTPREGDVESTGEKAAVGEGGEGRRWEAYWNVVVVMMPGQVDPTFLATPSTGKSVSDNTKSDLTPEVQLRQGSSSDNNEHRHGQESQHSGAGVGDTAV